MKLVTTEPAINEKYDAEVLRSRQVSPSGEDIWVCCPGPMNLASLPASTKDTHAILSQSLSVLG